MPIALVNSAAGEGSGSFAQTSAIDTTGANLLVIVTAGSGASVGDSKSNTWTGLTSTSIDGYGYLRVWYCLSPTVGTGHTFSVVGNYVSLCAAAYSGVDAYDQESTNNGSSAGTGTPGSVTPSANGALIVWGGAAGSGSPTIASITTGTVEQNTTGTNSVDYGCGLADYVQATAAAVNPTLTWGATYSWAAVAAVFTPTGGGSSPQTISAGLSTETDSALGMTASPGVVAATVGLAAETDSALGMTASPGEVTAAAGLAEETDTAFSITPYTGQLITLGLVTELDSAQAITVGPGAVTYPVGLVSESDLALDITASSSGSVSLSEADIAAIWDHEIMSGVSARLAMKVLMAGIVGKREGLGTEMELYYDLDGTTVRITFSPTDEAGNGTPVVTP